MFVTSKNIESFISSRYLTIEAVSRMAQVSHETVHRLVKGNRIQKSNGVKIAKALNVDFSVLFEYEKKHIEQEKTHYLKILPNYYTQILLGNKRFEVRYNDRNFKGGEYLRLEEWDQDYTGRYIVCKVTSVLDDPAFCKKGYVIMSIWVESIHNERD